MTSSELPSKEQLVEELQRLCAKVGYRAGTQGTEAIKDVPALIGLEIVGGPDTPSSILEWKDRREKVRGVLREIAQKEVAEQLDERYADAAVEIFRLNARQALDVQAHIALGKIQAPLDEVFGSPPGSKAFQDDHRPMIFEAMAQALLTRETKTRKPPASGRKRQKSPARKPATKAPPAKTKSNLKPKEEPAPKRSSIQIPPRRAARMARERRAAEEVGKAQVEETRSPKRNWTGLPDGPLHQVVQAIVLIVIVLVFLQVTGVLPPE